MDHHSQREGRCWEEDDCSSCSTVALLNGDATIKRKQEAAAADRSKVWSSVWAESTKLWVIVGPAIFDRTATCTMNIITQVFAGHLGDLELAAVTIANFVVVGFNYGLMVRTPRRPAFSTCNCNNTRLKYVKEYKFLSCTSGPGRVNYL
jgi:MATE family multidrug resistance protein